MVLYDLGLALFRLWLSIASLFNRKIREGIDGRKDLFEKVESQYKGVVSGRKHILLHVSSYGELEQAKPIIESVKELYPDAHMHLTFFSPSGYVNAVGKYTTPDFISYLPFDTKENMKRFVDIAEPDLVLFCRYDVWHNFVRELKHRGIPAVLFSATFTSSQFKSWPIVRTVLRRSYEALTKIFCISERDCESFRAYGISSEKLHVAGDTRYDQVVKRRNTVVKDESIVSPSLHDRLTQEGSFTIVAGSTWPSDEDVIGSVCLELMEKDPGVYLILAPHEVEESRLAKLEQKFVATSRLSFYNGARIVIVDSIGKLFHLYRYASVAYVGGGFGEGVHNVLEPAVWGAPIVIGPSHERSQEVSQLMQEGSVLEVRTARAFADTLIRLHADRAEREREGRTARTFVEKRQGACEAILSFVQKSIILRKRS